MSPVTTTTRNANLDDLVELLRDQRARAIDLVAPATNLRFRQGALHITGAAPVLEEAGVTDPNGIYVPTEVCDEGIADKLKIPLPYVRRLRKERPDLFDANANGWLHGRTVRRTNHETRELESVTTAEPDGRNFLVRAFRGDPGEPGVARAILSDSYKVLDNFDLLLAVLDGVRQAGVSIDIDGADLTDKRMYVRVRAPEVQAYAPDLLKGYRSPFSGNEGEQNPTVFAGFVVTNSETGYGAFSVTPRLVVQVCSNGMTISRDVQRAVHLGGKLEAGVVRWSEATQLKNIELVTAKARDAVATFLDVDYVRSVIRDLEEKAGVPVEKPTETIAAITKSLFSDEHAEGILAHFVRGGQLTAGGVLQAVTSYSQELNDADQAFDMEWKAVQAMELAAARS